MNISKYANKSLQIHPYNYRAFVIIKHLCYMLSEATLPDEAAG
jgi:hypothetical protein